MSVKRYAGKRLYRILEDDSRRKHEIGYYSFMRIEDGMTFEEFVERGGRPWDLDWDVEKGNVEIRDDKRKKKQRSKKNR